MLILRGTSPDEVGFNCFEEGSDGRSDVFFVSGGGVSPFQYQHKQNK